MKTVLALVLVAFTLFGCGSDQKVPTQFPGLTKTDWISGALESSVVVWNGELMTIASTRKGETTSTGETTVNLYIGSNVITVPSPRFAFISAIIDDGVLYIFGTVQNRSIQMVSSSDLSSWSLPVIVFEPSASIVYNTSVAKDADGFVMAYETDIGGPSTIQFAKSQDLVSWTPVSVPFHFGSYSACPTIRFIDGQYYVFYLSAISRDVVTFVTLVERSPDLLNWEATTNGYAVLSPEAGEGINTSDMDMAELNGKTYMVYLVGDQGNWNSLRLASYNSTLSGFVSDLFRKTISGS